MLGRNRRYIPRPFQCPRAVRLTYMPLAFRSTATQGPLLILWIGASDWFMVLMLV